MTVPRAVCLMDGGRVPLDVTHVINLRFSISVEIFKAGKKVDLHCLFCWRDFKYGHRAGKRMQERKCTSLAVIILHFKEREKEEKEKRREQHRSS